MLSTVVRGEGSYSTGAGLPELSVGAVGPGGPVFQRVRWR